MPNSIPDGYHAITPSLTLKNSKNAIAFYQKAFNAKVLDVFPNLTGDGLMHATIQIGDSIIMMGDEMPPMSKSAETVGDSPISLFLYVADVDAVFKDAIAAGGTVVMPVANMFWGDRAGTLKDPFGYQWMVATHKRDLTKAQIEAEAKEFFAQTATK